MADLIEILKNKAKTFQKANLLRHSYVATPLMNFTKNEKNGYYNLLQFIPSVEAGFNDHKLEYSPRYIYFSEFTSFHSLKAITENANPVENLFFNKNFKKENAENPNTEGDDNPESVTENKYNSTLDIAFDDFYKTNHVYRKSLKEEDEDFIKNKEKLKSYLYTIEEGPKSKSIYSNFIEVPFSKNPALDKFDDVFSIAVANTKVKQGNIFNSMIGNPNLSSERSDQLVKLLNSAEEVKADALLLPEVSFPFKYLYQIADEARRKQRLIIAGLEHLNINGVCYNFIAACLPMEFNGIRDVVIVLRLKNHYSPHEGFAIIDQGLTVPKPEPATYNLFKWRDINFSVYNCYELTDIQHRSIFKSKVDMLFACEYNKDVNYFSNIVESISRDIHCYFIQANTSDYGDSRITAPRKTEARDILRLKGGENDVVLLGKINIKELREFQATRLRGQDTRMFKNTPPSYEHDEAEQRLKRTKN